MKNVTITNCDCCDLQTAVSGTTAYHLQRALPGGIVLMELAFQVSSAVLTNTLYVLKS